MRPKLVSLLKRKGGDYSYAYGVVSGKHSKLLTYHQTENLALFKNLDELVAFLAGTEYEQDIQGAMGKRVDQDLLEKGVLSNFLRVYNEIAATLPQGDRMTLEKMTLGYIETSNLQIIIRMLHSGANPEDTARMLSPCKWSSEYVRELVESGSVEKMTGNLDAKYREGLKDELDDYKNMDSTIPLEVKLEKMLAKDWLSLKDVMSPDLQSYIAKNVDVMNITYALRIMEEHIDEENVFIEGGKYVTKKMFKAMAEGSNEEALNILSRTPFYNAAKEGIEHFGKTGSFIKLENLLNGVIIKRFADDALFRPLSMSSIILFIARKRMEVKNLRRIIVCIAGKIPANEIKEMLVRV
ncbi:MAG: V-type ATPase subunit [Candidatus Aenigmarchaeota archaeon]|nr:V-type ATPase subunit [Candidatus Aenigmarchaeota archaeon]